MPEASAYKASSQALEDGRNRRKLYRDLPLQDGELRILVLYPGRRGHRTLAAGLMVHKLPQRAVSPTSQSAHGESWRGISGAAYFVSESGNFWHVDTRCYYSPTNRYEALSYAWGSSETPCKIFVNGLPVRIGYNLYMALRHLRSRHRRKLLWVDALCINQGDDAEKAKQVAQMASIYRRAWRVVIWLGKDTAAGDGRLGLLFWAWYGSRWIQHSTWYDLDGAISQAKGFDAMQGSPVLAPKRLGQKGGLRAADREALEREKVIGLFQAPWFGRRWASDSFTCDKQKYDRLMF